MIVDLDSWEAGYDDSLLGRPSQCTQVLTGPLFERLLPGRACRLPRSRIKKSFYRAKYVDYSVLIATPK